MGYPRRDTSHKITTARARRQEQGRLAQEVCEGQGERKMAIATGGWEGNHGGNFFLLMVIFEKHFFGHQFSLAHFSADLQDVRTYHRVF